MSKQIASVFGPEGLLKRAFPGYLPRPSQIELALEVEANAAHGGRLLAEAPTGVGKSLGYLVPLIPFAQKGERVMIVTSSIVLQEQLVKKDLPLLARILPEPFSFALAKGMNNYLCLARETRVVTRDGLRPIAELAGKTVRLLDGNGEWTDAPIRSFGRERLLKVTLDRGSRKMIVHATVDHRWFVQPERQKREFEEVVTRDLVVGSQLAVVHPRKLASHHRPSPFGIAHGIVFGDGSIFGATKNGFQTATVVLHGKKNRELLRFFPGSATHEMELSKKGYSEDAVRVADLPRFFKEWPSLEEAPSYLYGWLAGYFAADGCVSKEGHATIASSRCNNLEFVEAVCMRLGIVTLPITEQKRLGKGKHPTSIFMLGFDATSLDEKFFVLSEHRRRFVEKKRVRRPRWRVVSVEQTERVEEVFCAIVPTTRSFVLEGYLLTGNCLNEYEDLAGDMAMTGSREPEIVQQWPEVKRWADKTLTGDVSELPFELEPKVRLRVTTNSDDCLGAKCAHVDNCWSRRARKEAKSAQVVVTNYHLFFADLTVKAGDPEAGPLPPYRHVVFDEGHDAPEIARDFFGFRVSPGAVRRAVRFLSGNANLGIPALGEKSLKNEVAQASESFFHRVSEQAKQRDYSGRLESAGAIDPTHLNQILSKVSSVYGQAVASELAGVPAGQQAVALAMQRLSSIRAQLEYAAALHEPTRYVYFFEALPPAVCMKPIDVGPMLDEHLFQRDDVKSIVMCSATLASGSREGERFNYFRREVGCQEADELVVESPFNFAANVLLYLPRPMPEPNAAEFPGAVADVCWDVCQAAGGRALLLFTSFRILKEVRQTFERRGAPWRLLVHGDAPRSLLIEQFKADETSVLLGCESFWQGVDVPGPALSAVVIDKIPFAHHDDPVMGAISAINPNWFAEYALPGAVIAMKQGFGRLIRTSTDRGVVAICDPRVRTKGYGKKITKSLPVGLSSTSSMADVHAFFAGSSAKDVHAERGAGPTHAPNHRP